MQIMQITQITSASDTRILQSSWPGEALKGLAGFKLYAIKQEGAGPLQICLEIFPDAHVILKGGVFLVVVHSKYFVIWTLARLARNKTTTIRKS